MLGRDWSAAGECGGKLVSRLNPQLAQEARQVTRDRACGDEQRLGDLTVDRLAEACSHRGKGIG